MADEWYVREEETVERDGWAIGLPEGATWGKLEGMDALFVNGLVLTPCMPLSGGGVLVRVHKDEGDVEIDHVHACCDESTARRECVQHAIWALKASEADADDERPWWAGPVLAIVLLASFLVTLAVTTWTFEHLANGLSIFQDMLHSQQLWEWRAAEHAVREAAPALAPSMGVQ